MAYFSYSNSVWEDPQNVSLKEKDMSYTLNDFIVWNAKLLAVMADML